MLFDSAVSTACVIRWLSGYRYLIAARRSLVRALFKPEVFSVCMFSLCQRGFRTQSKDMLVKCIRYAKNPL